MPKILVAYVTNAGSTTEVAEAIGKALQEGDEGVTVEVKRMDRVSDAGAYDAVVVGGPMIFGWHGFAVNFVMKHQEALSQIPAAYFFTALEITQTGEETIGGVPIYIDAEYAHPPKNPARLSFKENFARPASYLEPVLEKAPSVKPVSAAFFGGKLDYSRLNFLHKLFVRFVIRAKPGDYRNWDAIRAWAEDIKPALLQRD